MNNTPNLESILLDYMNVFRSIQREQNNAVITYLNSQREMNSSLSRLLLRYLEIHSNNTRSSILPSTIHSNEPSDVPSNITPPVNSLFSRTYRSSLQSPINTASYDFSLPSNNTNTYDTSSLFGNTPAFGNTSYTSSRNSIFNRTARGQGRRSNETRRTNTISETGTSTNPDTDSIYRNRNTRFTPRIRTRTRTTTTRTTIPRDIFQNFINNTLNMGNVVQPLNSGDISANITNLIYRDIADTTTQTICPFTQDNFSNNDEISRINPCGHIFTRSHLNRYLTNFDYRCPVCRRDLRRENDIENPVNSTNTLIDLSNNNPLIPNINNNTQTREMINNAVESVTNALMDNITNQISNDPSNNSFIAEYSFLIPGFNNSTNTTNTNTQFPSFSLQNYVGINNTSEQLPPLPEEDSNDEIPELEEDDPF
jgi:hypothetical protein